MSWHVEPGALRSYTDGSLAITQQFSIEAHLLSCPACRLSLASFTDRHALERTWDAIEAETSAPRSSPIERGLLRIGVSDHSARLLAATPSLRRSWLIAVGAVLALAVGLAHGAAGGYLFFLAVAPMLPLAGIAAAFGPGIDPTYEIGLAAPLRSFSLLLIRAVAVLVSTMSLGLIAALFLPDITWAAAAWLLPSLALVTSSLALSTFVHPVRAASAIAVVWVVTVGIAAWGVAGELALRSVFGGGMQVTVLVVTLAAGSFLFARRDDFETGEHS